MSATKSLRKTASKQSQLLGVGFRTAKQLEKTQKKEERKKQSQRSTDLALSTS